jgi:twitching motility protein PilT
MGRLHEYVRKLSVVNATELLIGAGRPPLYRARGELLPLPGEGPLPAAELESELQAVLTQDDWQVLETEQRVVFTSELTPSLRVRGACHVSAHGLTLKLNLLGTQSRDLRDVELPKVLDNFASAESGLLIVTGPASSGKSMLIGRLIAQLTAERALYVATSEDPVEQALFSRKGLITQRSVGRHVPGHAQAVETALETQAQVITCSDLTAPQVFERMIEAACACVLALGELRGQGVVSVLEQLLAAVPASRRGGLAADLADCLLGVVSLDLLPKKAGGRVLAVEALLATPNVCSLVRDGKLSMLQGLLDREHGMQSMDRCLLDLATRGVIDGREAYGRANDKRLFAAWG